MDDGNMLITSEVKFGAASRAGIALVFLLKGTWAQKCLRDSISTFMFILPKYDSVCVRQCSPDEVQQSICRGHHRPWTWMVAIFLWARPWVDDEHQHDADDDGDEGRPQVVGDG